MQQVDIDSPEFQVELERTWRFVEKVNRQFGFVQHPMEDVNEGVVMGLARNRLMYSTRFCPCFMVIGNTKEERNRADNRVCPCKPALEREIPKNGRCHCGLFCTPEYAKVEEQSVEIEEVVHQHSRGLTKDEAITLLEKEQLDGDELEALLEARKLNMVDFIMLDVRELMEYRMGHIVGTDALVPTSQFYSAIEAHNDKKQRPIIVYCHTGSRSFQVQYAMKSLGFKQVGNLRYGIISFAGEVQRG